jgi:hypothetical protein
MWKKTVLSVFVFVIAASALSGQTDDAKQSSEENFSQLIIRNDSWFSFHDYELYDGSPLKFGQVRNMLKTIPENEKIMKDEFGIRIFNYSFAAIAFSSLELFKNLSF